MKFLIHAKLSRYSSQGSDMSINNKGRNLKIVKLETKFTMDETQSSNTLPYFKNVTEDYLMGLGLKEFHARRFVREAKKNYNNNKLYDGGGTYPLRYFKGGSSDFGYTHGSYGSVNYPDGEWAGPDGAENHFRQFNKTGEFIPHSEVNRASVLTDGILGYKLAGGRRIRGRGK